MVQINPVRGAAAAAAPQAAMREATAQPESASTIRSAASGEKKAGIFCRAWSCVVALFSWVLGCFGYAEDVVSGINSAELLGLLKPLPEAFARQKRDLPPEQLAGWWQNTFDALPEDARRLLMIEDMMGWARRKLEDEDETPTEDHVRQHAAVYLLDETNQKKSLKFIRDLEVLEGRWNPVEYIPFYLQAAINYLGQQPS